MQSNSSNSSNSNIQQSKQHSNPSSNEVSAASSSIGSSSSASSGGSGGGGGGGGGVVSPKRGGGGGWQSKASSEENDMLEAMPATKGAGRRGYYALVLEDHYFEGKGVLKLKKGSEVRIEHFAFDKNWSLVVDGSGVKGVFGTAV